MSHRPLALVTGLTIGDYLLWNWSLNANHGVIALVSGLTLPPLTIALLWLVALNAARLLAHGSRARARRRSRAAKRRAVGARSQSATTQSSSPSSASSSRKIAA